VRGFRLFHEGTRELSWLVICQVHGKETPPTSAEFTFEVTERTWGEGVMRVLSVHWILGYPDPPAPRPRQRPIFIDKEQEADCGPTEKTLVRRCLTRRTTSKRRRHKDPLTRNPS
jgi:hypothetical protein